MRDDIDIRTNNSNDHETVFIVDDHDLIRDMLETVFSEFGYKVITACDGQDAVDKFKDHIDLIDIILMDIIMPLKDGVEAYKEICHLKPDVKIVFMSGYNDNNLYNLNPNISFLKKPFKHSMLLNTIRKTLDGVYQGGCP
jgi:DNA-binding NtrC family response regulator